jgi:hypothetical protein
MTLLEKTLEMLPEAGHEVPPEISDKIDRLLIGSSEESLDDVGVFSRNPSVIWSGK